MTDEWEMIVGGPMVCLSSAGLKLKPFIGIPGTMVWKLSPKKIISQKLLLKEILTSLSHKQLV